MNEIRTETASPWHSGERALQAKVGVAERMETLGKRVIRDYMPDQHREFYEHLPYLIIGAVDAQGWPWASVLDAQSGFIHSPDARRLDITRRPDAEDPVGGGFAPGAALGMLGIDLHTRRRNRLNGHISDVRENGFSVSVEHSYGNCPQYIQLRALKQVPLNAVAERSPAQRLTALDDAAIATIRGADTFFVASYVDLEGARPHRSVDVSHRGGQAGFVRVEGDVLTIPDFAGNLFFNTLGNFQVNPRAGLLFVDFQTGELLQVAGTVTLILDGPEIAAFQGAERLWQVRVEQVVRRPAALRSRWEFQGWSPNSLMTGDWQQTAARCRPMPCAINGGPWG